MGLEVRSVLSLVTEHPNSDKWTSSGSNQSEDSSLVGQLISGSSQVGILGRSTQHKLNMNEAIQDDDVMWWVDSGATVHVCKDKCWFKTYESLNDESILHMENESTVLVHGRGCVDLRVRIRVWINATLFKRYNISSVKLMIKKHTLDAFDIAKARTRNGLGSVSKSGENEI
ncbi:hypothetical protein Tco_0890052 [Tanacetum coccineum]